MRPLGDRVDDGSPYGGRYGGAASNVTQCPRLNVALPLIEAHHKCNTTVSPSQKWRDTLHGPGAWQLGSVWRTYRNSWANRLPILSPLEKRNARQGRSADFSQALCLRWFTSCSWAEDEVLRLADKLPTEGLTSHHLVEADQLPDQVLML